MSEIGCIFCGVGSNDVVIEEKGYKGRKCPQCGLIYISPRPSPDEIANLYRQDAAYISAESHISGGSFRRLHARRSLRIIRSLVKNGALLEIGPGGGYFLDAVRKAGLDPHGLEPNRVQAGYIRESLGIPCAESRLNASIFGGKRFDIIYHCDVISHLHDPIAEFKRMHEVMKDVSFMVFETGNIGEVDQRYFKCFPCFQYPDHLFFFSSANLVALLEKTGFEPIVIYRYSILPQLLAMRALSGLRRILEKHILQTSMKGSRSFAGSSASTHSIGGSKAWGARSAITKAIKNTYGCIMYVLRYGVGQIVPKAHRPQTVIVVAKRKGP
jgi:hypothetical protein